MGDTETIEIGISKIKTSLMFLACLAIVAAGITFVLSPEKFRSPVARSSPVIFIAGSLAVVLFGFFGVILFKRLFDKSPGLLISTDGITDQSSWLPGGFIPWSDMIAVRTIEVNNQRILGLVVKDPQKYIERQNSRLKKVLMKKNLELYGAAITISANGLKIRFAQLKQLIESRFSDYKANGS